MVLVVLVMGVPVVVPLRLVLMLVLVVLGQVQPDAQRHQGACAEEWPADLVT